MLLNQDLIITESAAESPEWEKLGLSYPGEGCQPARYRPGAAGIRWADAGLPAGFQPHRRQPGSFPRKKSTCLTIISNQAAPVIENVTLVIQARQRV